MMSNIFNPDEDEMKRLKRRIDLIESEKGYLLKIDGFFILVNDGGLAFLKKQVDMYYEKIDKKDLSETIAVVAEENNIFRRN